MKSQIALWSSVLVATATTCCGQGTFQIGFEGPPLQPPQTQYLVQQYFESGMWFRPIVPIEPGVGFGRVGVGISGYADNGTTSFLQAGGPDTLAFSFTNDIAFNLVSIDLAEYSTVVSDSVSVRFIGYRQNGSTVTADFMTDGVMDGTGPLADFQTFQFDGFTNLVRVELPLISDSSSSFSLDNLVVQPIPEPTSGALLLIGGLLLVCYRQNKLK